MTEDRNATRYRGAAEPTVVELDEGDIVELGVLTGRLEDQGEIERGGMGQVRRAKDTVILREVAVKLMDGKLGSDARWVQRFLDEARITGQLEHPNIVPIYDLGFDASGTPWFTMKLVRGVTLDRWLADEARRPGSPDRLSEGLEVFLKICDALGYAHSRGVIHRDLKPANVMVGEFGQVYVMDWGLARVLGSGVETGRDAATAARDDENVVIGTLGFMAPEQASGDPEACDQRTDVFGLGALLYALLTGKAPYPGTGVQERILAVRQGAYVPLAVALGDVPAPERIVHIVERAMSRDPADRYPTAAALKADVQRFLRVGLHLPARIFAAGEDIVREGERGDAAYLITRGRCVAFTGAGDQQRALREMGPGAVFGEMSVLSDQPRTATVRAVEPVTVLVVSRAVLDERVGLDGWLGALFRGLVARFRELETRP
ncbi:MAG: protein kinase [Polyangiaceae bacterium]|nr:protein kinase [Polyangiaceae bacterium]